MDKIKPLFTATATATGGRNGHTEASDGSVKADLSVPKAMGGPGKPNTATSPTAGCWAIASSTSRLETFSPPVLIVLFSIDEVQ